MANPATEPQSLPDDPREHYVQSARRVTLGALATLYREKPGCSLSTLKARCAGEGWRAQREAFRTKLTQTVDEKAAEKISEKKARTLVDLNEEHNRLIEHILAIGKGLLNRFVSVDPVSGSRKITCKPNEYRATAQTVMDLIRTQRLLHNFEPGKPMAGILPDDASPSPLLELLRKMSTTAWSDYDGANGF